MMVLAVWADVVRDGSLTVGAGPAGSSHKADWGGAEESVGATSWVAEREKWWKLSEGSLEKGEREGRAKVSDKANGLRRWGHGEEKQEWENEKGGVGLSPLKEMV